VDQARDPFILLYNEHGVCFLWVRRSGCGVEHPPLPSAEVKEIVELYLCLSSLPAWHVTEKNFIFCVAHTHTHTYNIYIYIYIYARTNMLMLRHWPENTNDICNINLTSRIRCNIHVLSHLLDHSILYESARKIYLYLPHAQIFSSSFKLCESSFFLIKSYIPCLKLITLEQPCCSELSCKPNDPVTFFSVLIHSKVTLPLFIRNYFSIVRTISRSKTSSKCSASHTATKFL
jgi:hypothetical protein